MEVYEGRYIGTDGNDVFRVPDFVKSWTINGKGGNDNLTGSIQDDSIFGGSGNDFLSGRDGDDFLSGGPGDDRLFGFDDNDELYGGPGNDTLAAGFGDNYVSGGSGNDTITTRSQNGDILEGGSGDDHISGAFGNDELYGGPGNDRLFSRSGDDRLDGGSGNDELIGSAFGNDTLYGGTGRDILRGSGQTFSGNTGELDLATGGGGADLFVLGDTGASFYRGTGDVLITDFTWQERDQIVVNGSTSNYSLEYSTIGSQVSTKILLRGDLIATAQNAYVIQSDLITATSELLTFR